MLLNFYSIAAAVVVGTVSGSLSLRWVRAGLHGGRSIARAVAVGFVGTVILSGAALFITGLDGFTLIHVTDVVLTVGVPIASGIVLLAVRSLSIC